MGGKGMKHLLIRPKPRISPLVWIQQGIQFGDRRTVSLPICPLLKMTQDKLRFLF